MDYTAIAPQEVLESVISALKQRNIEATVVDTKEEALRAVQTLIPAAASVMNGSSRTLEEIGFVEYLKAGQHSWNNLHEGILAEKDPAKQALLRRQALLSDYYVGSVHALAQTGEIVIASNTGSQLPHIVYSSPNVIFVVGAQKIVPTLEDARKRLRDYVVPLEEENMQQKYNTHTQLNKEFILFGENVALTGRRMHMILVKEKLGF